MVLSSSLAPIFWRKRWLYSESMDATLASDPLTNPLLFLMGFQMASVSFGLSQQKYLQGMLPNVLAATYVTTNKVPAIPSRNDNGMYLSNGTPWTATRIPSPLRQSYIEDSFPVCPMVWVRTDVLVSIGLVSESVASSMATHRMSFGMTSLQVQCSCWRYGNSIGFATISASSERRSSYFEHECIEWRVCAVGKIPSMVCLYPFRTTE